MKKHLFLMIIFLINYNISIAAETFKFSDKNSFIPETNNYYLSLFTFSEYTFSENLSLSLNPLSFFISPSVELKYSFYKDADLAFSSLHSVNYPTLLLSLVKSSGAGGFISPEFEIPNMVSVSNGLISTFKIDSLNYISAMILIDFALNNNDLNPATSIDLPVIFPRTAVLYKSLGISFTCISENYIDKNFNFDGSVTLFSFPLTATKIDDEYPEHSNMRYFAEINTNLVWKVSKKVNIIGGAKLCYGEYPFGGKWHLLPNINLIIF